MENGKFIDYSIVVKNMKFWFSYDDDFIKIILPVELQLITTKDYGEAIGELIANLSHISKLKSDSQQITKLQKLADQLGVNMDKFTEIGEMYNYLDDYDVQTL